MIAIPGDTKAKQRYAGIIADEMAIGMVNQKTTAVRSDPGTVVKRLETQAEFGGLVRICTDYAGKSVWMR